MQTVPENLKAALVKLGDAIIAGSKITLPIKQVFVRQSDVSHLVYACGWGCASFVAANEDFSRAQDFVITIVGEYVGYPFINALRVNIPGFTHSDLHLMTAVSTLNDNLNWSREQQGEWVKSLAEHPEWIIALPYE